MDTASSASSHHEKNGMKNNADIQLQVKMKVSGEKIARIDSRYKILGSMGPDLHQ